MYRLTAAAVAMISAAIAAEPPGDAARAASLLLGTTGTWEGTLTYLDYQSGEKTALPVTETVTLLPDRATLQTIAAYDDGPAGTVFIISLSALNAEAGTWESASFRKGDEMETGSVALSLSQPPTDDTHWTVVTTRHGTDGDSPAVIRHTITRDGATLTTTAEYDRKDDGKDEFAFRNQQILTLKP